MSVIEQVLHLQEIDIQVRELEREGQDVPTRKQQETARLKSHQEALRKSEDELKARLAKIKEMENEAATHRERIIKLRQQQGTIKSNKEFTAIETEIKTAQDQISRLEDRQIEYMEEVEAARQAVSRSKEELKDEENLVGQDVKRLDARLVEITDRLKALKADRQQAASSVDGEWLARYQHVMTRRDRALVPVQDGVCGGCHMQLPPSVIHRSRRQSEIVACEFCGRLLYS